MRTSFIRIAAGGRDAAVRLIAAGRGDDVSTSAGEES